MNNVCITGRLTRAPELKSTQGGKSVVRFSVAVDRPGTKDVTDFIDCVAWEAKAEFLSKFFTKGQRIEVVGVLTTRKYEKNNEPRTAVEIRADYIGFGESKKETTSAATKHEEATTTSTESCLETYDDDLPF